MNEQVLAQIAARLVDGSWHDWHDDRGRIDIAHVAIDLGADRNALLDALARLEAARIVGRVTDGRPAFTVPVAPAQPEVAHLAATLTRWVELGILTSELPDTQGLAQLVDAPAIRIEVARRCVHGAVDPQPYALADGRVIGVRRTRAGETLRAPGCPHDPPNAVCVDATGTRALAGAWYDGGDQLVVRAAPNWRARALGMALVARVAQDTGRRTFTAFDQTTIDLLGDARIDVPQDPEWPVSAGLAQAALVATPSGVTLRGRHIKMVRRQRLFARTLLEQPDEVVAKTLLQARTGAHGQDIRRLAYDTRSRLGLDGRAAMINAGNGYLLATAPLVAADDRLWSWDRAEFHVATRKVFVAGACRDVTPELVGVVLRLASLPQTSVSVDVLRVMWPLRRQSDAAFVSYIAETIQDSLGDVFPRARAVGSQLFLT